MTKSLQSPVLAATAVKKANRLVLPLIELVDFMLRLSRFFNLGRSRRNGPTRASTSQGQWYKEVCMFSISHKRARAACDLIQSFRSVPHRHSPDYDVQPRQLLALTPVATLASLQRSQQKPPPPTLRLARPYTTWYAHSGSRNHRQ